MDMGLWVPIVSGGLAGAFINVVYHVVHSLNHRRKRPKISLLKYEQEAPFFRLTPEEGGATAYYVNVGVRNKGHRTAHRSQPVVTAYGKRADGGTWEREKNWVPVGLRWALDELERQPSGLPRAERDLIPEPKGKTRKHAGTPARYRFNLVKISNAHPGSFHLLVLIAPYAQPSTFGPGKYCFQITHYCEEGEWDQRWYQVSFTGQFTPASLCVEELRSAPWAD